MRGGTPEESSSTWIRIVPFGGLRLLDCPSVCGFLLIFGFEFHVEVVDDREHPVTTEDGGGGLGVDVGGAGTTDAGVLV